MSIIKLSVYRPVLTMMFVLAFVVMGLYSFLDLGIELFPQIDFPFVTVRTIYVGAGPVEIENLITKKIEEEVSAINGVKTISSTSMEGVSIVAIEFEVGVDVDVAALDVKDKVEIVKGELPEDAEDPAVLKFDMGAEPVMNLAISGSRPLDEIYEITDDIIKPELMKIQGLASVDVVGGKIREIQVRVRRELLQSQDVSITDVIMGLASENLNIPSGHVTEQRREYNIRVDGEFETVDEIADIVLPVREGRTVRLRDVAYVVDDFEEQRKLARFNGNPSVGVELVKRSDANVVQVVDDVTANLDKVKALLPGDIDVQVASDNSTFIRRSIAEVGNNMGIGIILTGLILFLFLHTWQGTIVAAMAMPTSIIATFTLINLGGFTLNFMTLLGLAVTVGLLVTNSIVVLENIIRFTEKEEDVREACVKGTTEIAGAVAASTLTNVVVFTPIAFMSGIIGQFFFQFGLTVAFATIFSLLVSFTLTPMLASKLLKSDKIKTYGFDLFALGVFVLILGIVIVALFVTAGNALSAYLGGLTTAISVVLGLAASGYAARKVFSASLPALKKNILYRSWYYLIKSIIYLAAAAANFALFQYLFGSIIAVIATAGLILTILFNLRSNIIEKFGRAWDYGYGKFSNDYKNSLSWVLDHQSTLIFAIVLIFALSLSLGRFIGSEFMPSSDEGYISIGIELPPGTSMSQTDKALTRIERKLTEVPEIESYYTVLGEFSASKMGISQGVQYGSIKAKLVPLDERELSTTDVLERLKKDLSVIPTADLTIEEQESGAGGGGADVQVEIKGEELDELNRIGEDLMEYIGTIPGAVDIRTSSREGVPELRIVPNRKKMADYGISIASLAGVMRSNIDGSVATKYRVGNKEYDIRVQLDKSYIRFADRVRDITFRSNGYDIPITEIAEITETEGPTAVYREDKRRLVTLSLNVVNRSSGEVVSVIQERIDQLDLPTGYEVGFGRMTEMQEESFGELFGAMSLAIVLTFIVLAAILESYIHPFIIMMTLPLALIGVMLSLVITGKTLSIISLMAVVMLIGIVVNNGILMIDYTEQLRKGGTNLRGAILEAASVRLRPIIMTNIATAFSMLPLALELGEGSEMRSPMAIVSIGALITSTIFTLFVIPVLYNIVETLKAKSVIKDDAAGPAAE